MKVNLVSSPSGRREKPMTNPMTIYPDENMHVWGYEHILDGHD